MKMRFLALFLVLLGCSFAALSIPTYTMTPDTVQPGGSGMISVTVSNPLPATGTGGNKVTGTVVEILPASYMVFQGTRVDVGDLDPGSSVVLSFPFKVDDNAPSGIYPINIRAYGYEQGGVTEQQQQNFKGASVSIKVLNPPNLRLESDKTVIGDLDKIELMITNTGGVAKKATIEILGDISLFGTDAVYVDRLSGVTKVNVSLDSRKASEGANDVSFTIVYTDELGQQQTASKSLRLTVKKERLDLIFTQGSEIVTRKDGTLTLKVKNSGKALSDVRISFPESTISTRQESEIKLGNIGSGVEKFVSIPIYTSLQPGTNEVKIDVKWVEQNEEKEKEVTFPLKVVSDSDIGVFLEAKPAPLTVGGEFTLSVLVSNIGSYAIEGVTVKFVGNDALALQSAQEDQFIGGLEKDDFSTVQYKVRVNDSIKSGQYPVDIEVRYRDASGEWRTKVLEEKVRIEERMVATDNGNMIYLLIGVVVAAAVYWYFRRKK